MELDDLNLTELLDLARQENQNAHRGLGRDVLTALAVGEHIDLPPRRIDTYRDDIFLWVDAHWKQVAPLISCPLKTRSPRACHTCTDVQVAECVTKNSATHINFKLSSPMKEEIE